MNRSLLLGLLLLTCASPAWAKNLWVVLLPGTSLSDWQRADAPHLHQIMNTGSVALMNTRTARTPSDHVRETPESAALTLGAGSRAAGGSEATDFRPGDAVVFPGVTAGQLYTRRTGLVAPAGRLVNVQWPRILRENAAPGYDLRPGNIADALRQAGIAVSAGGGPLSDAVAASGDGWVTPAPPASGAWGPDCIIYDGGSDIHAADPMLAQIMARLGDGRLIVLSPSASDEAYRRGARLCPVGVWGPGVPPGLIVSASTRRAGLVTDTDFATTVAAFFGVPISQFPVRPFGERAWEYRPEPDAVPRLEDLNTRALSQWEGMRALPYLALLLGLWMLGVTRLNLGRPLPTWAASVPPALVLALLLSTSLVTLALWSALVLLSVPFLRPRWYCAALAALLVGDMALGDPLMRQSLLGYSAIEGARYYGIGNEAMGALVGACLVTADAAARALRPARRLWVWLGLAIVTALLGSPLAGAKAGGLIVALAGFGSYGWFCSGRRWDVRAASLGAVVIALLLLGVAMLDARLNGGQASHFGQAAARLSSGGVGEWTDIIRRKLAVEGHLLWHSAWAVPLWGGGAALLAWARKAQPNDRPLLLGGLVAAGVCLAVNDAGTVAASFCLVLLWSELNARTQQNTRPLPGQRAG